VARAKRSYVWQALAILVAQGETGKLPPGRREKSLSIVAASTLLPLTFSLAICSRPGAGFPRPGSPGTRCHWGLVTGVEQISPVCFLRRLVLEEPVQRQTRIGHLLHALTRQHVGAGYGAEEVALDSRPGDRGPLVRSAGQRTVSHGCPMGFGPFAASKGRKTKRQRMEFVGRNEVQRATGKGARPTLSTVPNSVDFVDTGRTAVGALVTGECRKEH